MCAFVSLCSRCLHVISHHTSFFTVKFDIETLTETGQALERGTQLGENVVHLSVYRTYRSETLVPQLSIQQFTKLVANFIFS